MASLRDTLGIFKLLNTRSRPDYLASPWSEGELTKLVWSDVFGLDYAPMSREEAMGIPALSKARDLLCNTVAEATMLAVRGHGPTTAPLDDDKQPAWLYRTDGAVGPYLRMAWTIDDLLFYGASAWYCDQLDASNRPLDGERIPYEEWDIDPSTGKLVDSDGVAFGRHAIYIPSHTAGLLDRSGSVLRAAAATTYAVSQRARVPIPVMEISIDAESEITDEEAKALVVGYNKARNDPDGATIVSPPGVTLLPHGTDGDAGFMVEGRNAVRLDMGNITGVPGALLDGSTATATLTYSTTEGKRDEFREYGAGPWFNTIRDRFSQDDCLPRGQRVEFDFAVANATVPPAIDTTRQD
jgi:hypothetical protein